MINTQYKHDQTIAVHFQGPNSASPRYEQFVSLFDRVCTAMLGFALLAFIVLSGAFLAG